MVVETVKMHGVHENLLQNWTFSGGDENFSMSLLFPSAFAVPWARTAEVSSDREGDFGGKSPITPPLQRMSLSKKAFFLSFNEICPKFACAAPVVIPRQVANAKCHVMTGPQIQVPCQTSVTWENKETLTMEIGWYGDTVNL